MASSTAFTVLIVPGLRDHVAEHWQTLLAARLPNCHTVPPLETDKLSLDARVAAIQHALDAIEGPVVLVAHSAGVLMTVHWAARHSRPILGALLATPPCACWKSPPPTAAARPLACVWPSHASSPTSVRSACC